MTPGFDYQQTRNQPLPVNTGAINGMAIGRLQDPDQLNVVLRYAQNNRIHHAAIGLDGQMLWQFDTGLPARGGWDGNAHHCPFVAWDIDGDGEEEVICHSAGTAADFHGDYYGVGAIEGEKLVVLDGSTGQIKNQCPWPGCKPRIMMTVGHLDGWDQPPALVICDETYKDEVITVINGPDLSLRWRKLQGRPAGHNVDCADVDGDGRQEIIVGGICYRPDGDICWRAEPFGHTDMSKPAKIRPDLPGLQTWFMVEGANPGVYLVDSKGNTLWHEPYRHAHFGWIGKQDPTTPGLNPHAAEDARNPDAGQRDQEHFPIFNPDGSHWCNLSDRQRKSYIPVAWRGDGVTDFIDRKQYRIIRLQPDGEEQLLCQLPQGTRLGRNLITYAQGDDPRESIITVDEQTNHLVAYHCAQPPDQPTAAPRHSNVYRHDRSQTGSGYYLYCCWHEGWNLDQSSIEQHHENV